MTGDQDGFNTEMRHNEALMTDKTDRGPVFTSTFTLNNNNQPIKYALERKLQQRTPREQLIEQGIMPALATAPSLLSQKTKLERAKTGDYLQKKIRVRPNRAQLVQRHILNDVSQTIDPSLLANQMKLKRKKLEDDLNERLAVRPGPLELVKDNILEQGTAVGLAIQEGNIDYTETAKSQLLEPISPESLDGSPEPSPDGNAITLPPTSVAELLNQNTSLTLSQGTHPLDGKPAEESQISRKEGRSRKKSPKPKFKKYKYHEYRPPNGEMQKSNLPMDSPYALMLQQQQLYLQLQVLYQNYPQFVSMPSIPENAVRISNNNNKNVDDEKPVKIEDMRVVDMRKELKMRGLPVSGSKTDLIERLKASLSFSGDQATNSLVNASNELVDGSPSSVSCSIASGTPVPVTSVPTTAVSQHSKLGRSNSLPAHEARLQQVQMQLMANSKKLQTQLPPEVQQQLQHLQYLNLQTRLQQLHVQPQTNIQPKPIQFNVPTSSAQQPVSVANQQPQVSTLKAPIKKELNTSDSCFFSQQLHQQSTGQGFTHPTSNSETQGPFLLHPISTNQAGPVMTQALPSITTNSVANVEHQKQHMQNVLPAQSQGLLHLKAEANKLNIAASHSEPDLSHMDKLDPSSWNQGIKHLTHENKAISPSHGSPCHAPSVFAPSVQQVHQEHATRVKSDNMQRSYSECAHEDGGGIMMHAVGQDSEKQRSMSEPANPFVHRRSCSLPSGQLFFDHVNPPPSYEAHMAAQMQRKLSQEHIYQPQQVPAKAEDMDLGVDTQQDRELTQELQRAMLKQDLGLDNDEILEILGASVGSSISSPGHSTANKVVINSPVNQLSPQRFGQPPVLHYNTAIPKSPSTTFLGVHNSSSNQQFQGRLSRSCEDVTGSNYNHPNNVHPKPGMQSSTEGSLADLDSIIMSPASPMRIDSDSDHLMPMSSSIPIPSNYVHKTDTLSWLDLSNSPTMTSPTGASTEVTYMNRTSPPPTLYGASPSLHSEQFPLSLFELDGTGSNNLSHDFSEAMDFCV